VNSGGPATRAARGEKGPLGKKRPAKERMGGGIGVLTKGDRWKSAGESFSGKEEEGFHAPMAGKTTDNWVGKKNSTAKKGEPPSGLERGEKESLASL